MLLLQCAEPRADPSPLSILSSLADVNFFATPASALSTQSPWCYARAVPSLQCQSIDQLRKVNNKSIDFVNELRSSYFVNPPEDYVDIAGELC